ncbi:unnamed protein product [Trichogramma brassicae]|uniref:Uncharacterized protein n=1 Tax=Trichogramma brassicae TaxID=86971 RepID=A0A6H5I1P8_9HYME|nr:unnamed protein product [Trichogramma brassicae]
MCRLINFLFFAGPYQFEPSQRAERQAQGTIEVLLAAVQVKSEISINAELRAAGLHGVDELVQIDFLRIQLSSHLYVTTATNNTFSPARLAASLPKIHEIRCMYPSGVGHRDIFIHEKSYNSRAVDVLGNMAKIRPRDDSSVGGQVMRRSMIFVTGRSR